MNGDQNDTDIEAAAFAELLLPNVVQFFMAKAKPLSKGVTHLQEIGQFLGLIVGRKLLVPSSNELLGLLYQFVHQLVFQVLPGHKTDDGPEALLSKNAGDTVANKLVI